MNDEVFDTEASKDMNVEFDRMLSALHAIDSGKYKCVIVMGRCEDQADGSSTLEFAIGGSVESKDRNAFLSLYLATTLGQTPKETVLDFSGDKLN